MLANFVKTLSRYQRIFIGFSGGLDSTVLLHAVAQYSRKITAVHIHHGLSPNADNWQNHCQTLCKNWDIPLITQKVTLPSGANIEEEARNSRYKVFASLVTSEDCLLLGHHKNDQAETLLLQLCRGAGIDGLSSMHPQKGVIFRPLLAMTRSELEHYAQSQQLYWIDDESNQSLHFSRNYLRHEILPRLGERWPKVVNKLARTAQLCQEAQANLDALAELDCPNCKNSILSLTELMDLPPQRLNNVLRFWLKSNAIKLPGSGFLKRIVNEVISAKEDAHPKLLCGSVSIRRYQQTLYLQKERRNTVKNHIWTNFPETLYIEHIGNFSVKESREGVAIPAQSLIEIRFRKGGELFPWHGQRKQLKKLMQDWKIPPWLRERIPLLFINQQIAAVLGYAISDTFYTKEKPAYNIEYSAAS